jgi:hypothetical protein
LLLRPRKDTNLPKPINEPIRLNIYFPVLILRAGGRLSTSLL